MPWRVVVRFLTFFQLECQQLQADGGKVVLCFVEFADARCAATALEALQGKWNDLLFG